MTDSQDPTPTIVRLCDTLAEKLHQYGVSDADIGKALVAQGLSRWSRAIGAERVAEQLAGLTLDLAEAVGMDLDAPKSSTVPH